MRMFVPDGREVFVDRRRNPRSQNIDQKAAGKGGLDQDSVWRRNPEYKKVLDHVLGE